MRMTPQQASAYFARLATDIPRYVAAAESASLLDARILAIRLSQGTYSSAALAALGHPYARRRPKPPQNPAIINEQSGLFVASWYVHGSYVIGGECHALLTNTAPYAGYMFGTYLMIERPVYTEIISKVTPLREKRILRALALSMRF